MGASVARDFNHQNNVSNQQSLAIISWPLTALRVARLLYLLNVLKHEINCASMDQYEIVDFNTLSETVKKLIREAAAIRKRAYCPYSNFAVGAAILTEAESRIYTGCNIENSALTPCICAERAAVPKAVCDGFLKFKIVAVVAHQRDSFTAPCGVCRQTLSEFRSSDGDIDVYLSKPTMDKVLCTKLSKLLPLSFVSYKNDSIQSDYFDQ